MILCFGEALIDMIPEATVGGPEGFVPRSGGAVFNTAIALGRLGTDVGLVSGISDDVFGRQLIADLHDSNVNCDLVIRSDRPTTLAFVTLNDGVAEYAFFDENSAGRMLRAEDMPQQLPQGTTALFFGGISLVCEPGAAAYEAVCLSHAARAVVFIDPNIRPGFIADAQGYRQRLARMLARADIVKVSDEDLDWLIPAARDLDDALSQVLSMGPSVAIVTRGAAGAIAATRAGERAEAAGREVDVVDTVGAGDTFNAGFLWSLAQAGCLAKNRVAALAGRDLADALEAAVTVSSAVVARKGAQPPWLRELARHPHWSMPGR